MKNKEVYHNIERVQCKTYVGDKALDPQQLEKDGITEDDIKGKRQYIAFAPRCSIRYHTIDVEGKDMIIKKKMGPTEILTNNALATFFGVTNYDQDKNRITMDYIFSSQNPVSCTIIKGGGIYQGLSLISCYTIKKKEVK